MILSRIMTSTKKSSDLSSQEIVSANSEEESECAIFPKLRKLTWERVLILFVIVFVFLGPSAVLEWNFGERANYFTNSRSSNLEITAYYLSFQGIQNGIPPWRDPQTLGVEDRFLLPSMAVSPTGKWRISRTSGRNSPW